MKMDICPVSMPLYEKLVNRLNNKALFKAVESYEGGEGWKGVARVKN